jgi:hypothetical protein
MRCCDITNFNLVESEILKPCTVVNVANWIKIQGLEYRESSVVFCKSSHESINTLPEFSVVKEVIVLEERIYLLLLSLKTSCFDEHYHSF